ncbi:MAG: family 43 glycosylhydrolase [Clostridia bacterium]|nr:family 43 glycosylhydrolase [Clostridia bacterium]
MKRLKRILPIVMIVLILAITPFFVFGAGGETEKTVYVSSGAGNDSAAGSLEAPFRTLKKAFSSLPDGGRIVITDRCSLGDADGTAVNFSLFKTSPYGGTVTVTSKDGGIDYRQSGADLYFTENTALSLGGNTVFDDVKITSNGSEVVLIANFHSLSFGGGFVAENEKGGGAFLSAVGGYFSPMDMNLPASSDPDLTIESGEFKRVVAFSMYSGAGTYLFTGKANVKIRGGIVERFYGANLSNHYGGDLRFYMTGGTVKELYAGGDATRSLSGNALIFIGGGTVGTVSVNNVVGNAAVVYAGGRITGGCAVSYANDSLSYQAKYSLKAFYYGSGTDGKRIGDSFKGTGVSSFDDYKKLDLSQLIKDADLSGIEIREETVEPLTVFLSSAGSDENDGSVNSPLKTLTAALNAIRYNGGFIVLKDKYTMGEGMRTVDNIPRYEAVQTYRPVTVTSMYGGVDYGAAGAELFFPQKSAYLLGGDTVFENLRITTDATDVYIAACFNKLTFGEGVVMQYSRGSQNFLYAIGGYFAPETTNLPADRDAEITIDSGSFKKVIGFTHVKGMGTYTFTGTSYVTVNGGQIDELFGASNYNHYSGSTVIKVYGGKISLLYAGGDATRRLDGSADIYLYAGTVTGVTLNNVLGDVHLTIDSAKIVTITKSYASDAIASLAAESKFSLDFNSVYYSSSWIERYTFFDTVRSFGTAYAAENGTGSGKSADDPCGDLSAALAILSDGGGSVVVSGKLQLKDFTEQSHKNKITVRGTAGAELSVSGVYTLGGDTEFENITITSERASLDGNGHELTVGENVVINGDLSLYGTRFGNGTGSAPTVIVRSGRFDRIVGAFSETQADADSVSVLISGGEAKEISLLSGNVGIAEAYAVLDGGKIGTLLIGENGKGGIDSLFAAISGGEIGSLTLSGKILSGTVKYTGGILSACQKNTTDGTLSLKNKTGAGDASVLTVLEDALGKAESENTVYVRDGGAGNGATPLTPVSDLQKATEILAGEGRVVLVGKTSVKEETVTASFNGTLTLTSAYGEKNYADHGAVLELSSSLKFSSPVVIENLSIHSAADDACLYFQGYKAVLGEGILSSHSASVENYVSLCGGSDAGGIYSANVTVNSGKWNLLTGGNSATGVCNGAKFSLTVNGGEFYGQVVAAGRGRQSGSATAEINGGVFYAGVYGVSSYTDKESFSGHLTIRLNGGTFYCKVSPGTRRTCTIDGDFLLELNGGSYDHVTDIEGTEKFAGSAKSEITVGSGFDIVKRTEGAITYQNPVRRTADPRIIYVDGMYYYVYTTGSVLSVYKAANIPDLRYALPEPVWDSRQVADRMDGRCENIWPSELQYFSAEDFGEEYAGWYILFSIYSPSVSEAGYSDGENRRSYVLKSETDDLQGKWINPETGEENVPAKFCSDTYDYVNERDWTAGQSTMRYNGEVYALYIVQTGRGTSAFKQTMCMSKMKNPWTITGEIVELVNPEYDWEREGYGYSSAQNIWYPAVIEGATPVNGPDGELFVLYAGSGYWTPGYCLGQMTFLGGDLFDLNNWKKSPTPIFKKNNEVCGVGGPCLISSPDGKKHYLLYHAYLGSDTTGLRYCFMEEYTVDATGFHVGQDGVPSPLATEFSVDVNETPVFAKISGFENWDGTFLFAEEGLSVEKATPETVTLRVYGGGNYDPSFGEIRFSYLKDGVKTEGLPQEKGEYRVFAELYGEYAYAGLGGAFTLTVGEGASGRSVSVEWILAGGAFAVIAAAAVLLIILAKRGKKE